MWFEKLFGFREHSWSQTQAGFVHQGSELTSLANGRRFSVGEFSTPSLGALRQQAQGVGKPGTVRLTHERIGDVLSLHGLPNNRGALFQAASQFNCLEFPGPCAVPEDGITCYAHDATQGPACSLAAAAATVVRNYFVPVAGEVGQTRDRQLNTLSGLIARLGSAGGLFQVRNGYTFSTQQQLAALSEVIAASPREALLETVCIGLHTDVEVTFSSRWVEPEQPSSVSQAFCSAISCGYSDLGSAPWESLARLVLDASYEATLWAAILDAARGRGAGKVWLTFVGGGVFANPQAWIIDAITRAMAQVQGFELDIRIGHYRRIDGAVVEALGGVVGETQWGP